MQVEGAEATAQDVMQDAARYLATHDCRLLLVNSHTVVADCLYGAFSPEVERLERKHDVTIIPVARQDFARDESEITHVER